MAKMLIEKGYFNDRAQVMEDIRDTGYWPTTYLSGTPPELPRASSACSSASVSTAGNISTRAEARADVFDYIERFHNPRRARRADQREKDEVALIKLSVKKG